MPATQYQNSMARLWMEDGSELSLREEGSALPIRGTTMIVVATTRLLLATTTAHLLAQRVRHPLHRGKESHPPPLPPTQAMRATARMRGKTRGAERGGSTLPPPLPDALLLPKLRRSCNRRRHLLKKRRAKRKKKRYQSNTTYSNLTKS